LASAHHTKEKRRGSGALQNLVEIRPAGIEPAHPKTRQRRGVDYPALVGLTGEWGARKFAAVNAREIIREIAALPCNEQVEVIRYVYRLDAERKLTGGELTSLAERLAHTTDPAEGLVLRDAIVRGFYGAKPDA
jgi:hypothetical protein